MLNSTLNHDPHKDRSRRRRMDQAPARRVAVSTLVFLFTHLLGSKEGWAWGRLGHEIIAEVASEIATDGSDFWLKQSSELGTLATVPDSLWKSGPSAGREGSTHWFHLDAYTSPPWQLPDSFRSYAATVRSYGERTVIDNGTALWRVDQLFELSQEAFQVGDYERGLQMAGVMAHYVADLGQPLHVTEDYDGRNGSKTGIHSFFESSNVQTMDRSRLKSDVQTRAQALLADPTYRNSLGNDIPSTITRLMMRSADSVETILDLDESLGRSGQGARAQLELALERMADSTATLAWVIGRLWVEGGRPPIDRSLDVSAPAWVAPSYIGFLESSFEEPPHRHSGHDCH
jgi:hypothetical protein